MAGPSPRRGDGSRAAALPRIPGVPQKDMARTTRTLAQSLAFIMGRRSVERAVHVAGLTSGEPTKLKKGALGYPDLLHLETPPRLDREYVQLPPPRTASWDTTEVGDPEHHIPPTVTSPVKAFEYLKETIPEERSNRPHETIQAISSALVVHVERHNYLRGFSARVVCVACMFFACKARLCSIEDFVRGCQKFGISPLVVRDGYNALWLRRHGLLELVRPRTEEESGGLRGPLPREGKTNHALQHQDLTGKKFDDQAWRKHKSKVKGIPSPLRKVKCIE